MKAWKIISPIIIVVMLSGLLLGASCSSDGKTGVGIENAVNNGDGTFTLNFTDGTSFTTSNLTGPQGAAGGSMAWQGAWSVSTSYSVDDAVENNGSSYICIQEHVSSAGDEPGVDGNWATYWNLFAQVGDTGPEGPKGDTGNTGAIGDTGLVGPQGNPGPNMIVAMGTIHNEAIIFEGYNIDYCAYNWELDAYEITLTGISYSVSNFITIVTPQAYYAVDSVSYSDLDGKLLVLLRSGGFPIEGNFSFMVLEVPS